MDATKFVFTAKHAIVKQWERNEVNVLGRDHILPEDVFVVWQCKTLKNFKAVFGVYGSSNYYEFTWDGDENRGYLDTYLKMRISVVEAD